MNSNLEEIIELINGNMPYKIILSKLRKNTLCEFVKICISQKNGYFQAEKYTKTQVFHEKILPENLKVFCINEMETHFLQLNSWSDKWQYQITISKKGIPTYNRKKVDESGKPAKQLEHNRQKNYMIKEGAIIRPLIDMGVFTADGKVIANKYDKYKQINRFLEIIDDSLKTYDYDDDHTLNVVDFGCGKSYLTFVVYYFLTEIKKYKVRMVGLDLKEDVINKCNESARKYGYSNLSFKVGDIGCYDTSERADMVITLHACDTATDYALYHAISWKTKMIFSVPCCQHELNQQFNPNELDILGRYGIIKERMNALMTDAIRANLLEYCGYRTQVMEFVDIENTPKNLLIRAVSTEESDGKCKKINPINRTRNKEKYLSEVHELMQKFGFHPTLYKLLLENGYI